MTDIVNIGSAANAGDGDLLRTAFQKVNAEFALLEARSLYNGLLYTNRGAWVTSTAYVINDLVTNGGVVYCCQVAHTSGTFATDLAAGKWTVHQGVTTTQLAAPTGATLVGTYLADGSTATTVPGALAEIRTTATTNAAISATAVADIRSGLSDTDAMQLFASDLAAGTTASAAAFGDSTMWGADPASLGTQVTYTPPIQLQNLINTFHGNSALTVVNSAISGTTAAQMLAGTDGSGSTFAARVGASSARVIYCNHGVNDAYGANATTASVYRANLISIVKIIRAASKTPVLVTPHPCLTIGTFGSQARAEATARFAQIMREVAAQHGVILVDNNRWMTMMMQQTTAPLTLLPDGVHGSASAYITAGNNLADAVLGGQIPTIAEADQVVTAACAASVRATSIGFNSSGTSRFGVSANSGTTTPQTLRVVFRVDTTGLDISMLAPMWTSGSASISVNIDGSLTGGVAPFSQAAAAGFAASFWQDYETPIARNIAPGFHMLLLTTAATGAAGFTALRSRATQKPLGLTKGTVTGSQRTLLANKLDLQSGGANTVMLFDNLPAPRYLEALELEWTGQMLANSGICIGGIVGDNTGPATAQEAIRIGLNASGYISFQEASGAGTYSSSFAFGSTDLSAASHTYRIVISSASFGTLSVAVDGTQVGSAQALSYAYYGGVIGLYKIGAGGTLTITDLCRVWRP